MKLAYRGLGEFAVGFTFGPLITLGIYLVMSGRFDFKVMIVGLPLGFLIANVLWINQYPDYEADMKGNKKLGSKAGQREGYSYIWTAVYIGLCLIYIGGSSV